VVERLRVLWPSGVVEVFESLAPGQQYAIKEGAGVVAVSP
jgi:hypothetical protein